MARLSQKEVLDEGIGSVLKGLGKAAVGAGKVGLQTAGAVGNVLKYGSEAGVEGTLTGTMGAAKGGYLGTKDRLTTKRKKLEEFLDNQGLMKVKISEDIKETPHTPVPIDRNDFKGKVAIISKPFGVTQYDFTKDEKTGKISEKVPMEGVLPENGKYRWKDKRWEMLRDKPRKDKEYGVDLDQQDIEEAKKDPDHPLAGKIIKHQTRKGNIAYGTLIGVVDEYAAIDPHSSSKAPGIYGVDINAIAESTEDEAAQSAPKTQQAEGTNQKTLLRQLHLLQG